MLSRIRFLFSFLVLVSTVTASTIRVPQQASDIQTAIDFSSTGDTVLVAPGLYQENLTIQSKGIMLLGEAGADSTFLEPRYPYAHTIELANTGAPSVIRGFTIRNGGNIETISIGYDSPTTVSHCIFHDNIEIVGSNLTVVLCHSPSIVAFNLFYNNQGINCVMAYEPCRIVNNTIDGNARGIYTIEDGKYSVALNNSITNNAGYGVLGQFDTLAYNNVWGNNEGNVPGDNGFSFEPYYVSKTTIDYRLQPASPNIDRATADIGIPHDSGQITDIGAYQRRFSAPYAADLRIVDQELLHVTERSFDIAWTYFDTLASTQTAYELELWTDSSNWPFYQLLWSTGQISGGDSVIAYPGGDSVIDSRIYRLRARVNNGVAWGDWRERVFRINTPPPVPTPRLPYNTEIIGREFARLAVTTVTDLENDTVEYFYELYTDADLTQFVAAGSLLVARNDTLARSDTLSMFSDDAEVWWRARSFDGYEYSNWCPTRRFTLRVQPHRFTVPGDFSSISDAIESAIDGDTIDVVPGIYRENIEIIDKAVVLRGTGGRDATFLEPLNSYQPILIREGDKVNTTEISGFTFRFGNNRGVALQSCRVRFENNEIHDCVSSEDGGGLYVLGVEGLIANNLFHDDSSGRFGGAVFIAPDTYDSLLFRNNRLWNNYAARGAAICSRGGLGWAMVDHNVIFNNTGADSAGAYFSYQSGVRFSNNTLVGNTDAYRCYSNQGAVVNNIFAKNSGEAIIYPLSRFYSHNCLFYQNGNVMDHDLRDGFTNTDPLFVDATSHDYRLQESSPCINAGYEYHTYYDPDGTRGDIGAYPYELQFPVAINPTFRDYPAERMVSHNPILSWGYFDTLASTWEAYELQVGETRDPFVPSLWNTGEILSSDTGLAYGGAALEDGHGYVYRVRLRSDLQAGTWIYKDLHMNIEPEAPVPVTPVQDQVVNATAVQLRVDSVANVEGDTITYDFQIFPTPMLSVPVCSISDHPSPMSPDFNCLTGSEQYWWRARAHDGWEYGPWSVLQSFQTRSGATVVEIPDDFTTIQPALNVLSSGDTIKLSPGVHSGPGNRNLEFYGKAIVVTSTAGAQWTTIDLESTKPAPHRLLVTDYQSEQIPVFCNVHITGGDADSGGVIWNSTVRFEKCLISGNTAAYGAVVYGGDATVEFIQTTVEDNEADLEGGVGYQARLFAEASLFRANIASSGGVTSSSEGTYVGTTFEGNSAGQGSCFASDNNNLASCLLIDNGPGSLGYLGGNRYDHCTIARNSGTISWLDFWSSSGVRFNSCLIADNNSHINHCEPDPDWIYHYGVARAEYCNLYNNIVNYTGCLSDDADRPGNMSLDPLFCDPDNNNFHLQSGSPCLGAGEDGTDIGAFGEGCIPTEVDDPADNSLPTTYALQQNYPNPFNPTTLISFDLPVQASVRLEVFNILGQRVTTLIDQPLPAGTHDVTWDGTNAGDGAVSSGVYFYRLTTETWSQSRKMLLLK